MLLHMFIGSLLPYVEGLDSWLFDGTLDDPCEEVILMILLIRAYVFLGCFTMHRFHLTICVRSINVKLFSTLSVYFILC